MEMIICQVSSLMWIAISVNVAFFFIFFLATQFQLRQSEPIRIKFVLDILGYVHIFAPEV